MMHELVVVKSSLIGKKHKNLIRGGFVSYMHVLHKVETKLLPKGVAHILA
jgi:hypothetical protein